MLYFFLTFLITNAQQIVVPNQASFHCSSPVYVNSQMNFAPNFNKIVCPNHWQYAFVSISGSGLSDEMKYNDANGVQANVGVVCVGAATYYPQHDIYRGQYFNCGVPFTIEFCQQCCQTQGGYEPSITILSYCNITSTTKVSSKKG